MKKNQLDPDLKEAIELVEFAARSKVYCELAINELAQQYTNLSDAKKLLDGRFKIATRKVGKATDNLQYAILNLLRINQQP